jgi:hypothetical protein
MKNLTIALMAAAAFTSVGCKKKGGGAGEAMAKMTEFKDKMCACKDAKCAQGVQEEMTKWSQEMAKNAGDKKPEPMSEEDTKKYSEATTKMAECAQKAMGAGGADPGSAAGSAEAGSAAAGSAAAGSAAAPAVVVGEGPVVGAMTLADIDLPKMKGFDKANWSAVEAEKDGLRKTVLKEGDTMYVGINFFDCNLPKMKEFIDKPVDERSEWQYCFVAPAADAAKVKTYPRMDAKDDEGVAIKVGHVIVHATIFEKQKDKIKREDLAAYLETVDFSSIEK